VPVFKDLTVAEGVRVLIWRVDESEEWLLDGMHFCPHSRDRLRGMKSGIHRRAFASIRYLFRELGYSDSDVVYTGYGKPEPRDGSYISITHSGLYTALIHSPQKPVGIDIELQRDKILRIASKFTRFTPTLPVSLGERERTEFQVRMLTAVWGVKESIYKLYGEKGLSFLDHITAEEIHLDVPSARASVNFRGLRTEFVADFLEFDGYTCVWVLGEKNQINTWKSL